MPATLILAEAKLPALIIAYLAFRRSDADYPVPAANLLTLVAGPVKDTTTRSHPSLEVWCPSWQLRDRRDNEELEVYLDLHASPDTARATEQGWLLAIRRAFAGGPDYGGVNAANSRPFESWINDTLVETEPSGWRLDNFYISSGSTLVLDQHRVVYRTEARALMRTQTHTIVAQA